MIKQLIIVGGLAISIIALTYYAIDKLLGKKKCDKSSINNCRDCDVKNCDNRFVEKTTDVEEKEDEDCEDKGDKCKECLDVDCVKRAHAYEEKVNADVIEEECEDIGETCKKCEDETCTIRMYPRVEHKHDHVTELHPENCKHCKPDTILEEVDDECTDKGDGCEDCVTENCKIREHEYVPFACPDKGELCKECVEDDCELRMHEYGSHVSAIYSQVMSKMNNVDNIEMVINEIPLPVEQEDVNKDTINNKDSICPDAKDCCHICIKPACSQRTQPYVQLVGTEPAQETTKPFKNTNNYNDLNGAVDKESLYREMYRFVDVSEIENCEVDDIMSFNMSLTCYEIVKFAELGYTVEEILKYILVKNDEYVYVVSLDGKHRLTEDNIKSFMKKYKTILITDETRYCKTILLESSGSKYTMMYDTIYKGKSESLMADIMSSIEDYLVDPDIKVQKVTMVDVNLMRIELIKEGKVKVIIGLRLSSTIEGDVKIITNIVHNNY